MRLFLYHLGRTWKLPLIAGLVLCGFHVLIIRIYLNFAAEGFPMPFGKVVPKWAQSFFGMDQLPMTSLPGFLSLAYQHPFMLAVVLSIPIAVASKLLAGEVEKKTASLLLARPVSRVGMVCSASLACALWSALVVAAAVGGSYLGVHWFKPSEVLALHPLRIVALNLYVTVLAIGGLAILFSALTSERSDATGWVVTITLAMYVWNFLVQIWPAASAYGALSLFHFYIPTQILLGSALPAQNLGILAAVAVAGFLVAGANYALRDFNI